MTMKPVQVIAFFALMSHSAFPQLGNPPSPRAAANSFEQPGPVSARDFVPENYLQGTLHKVWPQAENDGFNNAYWLETPSRTEEIIGSRSLMQRIRELYALEHLRKLSKTDEFGKALAKSAEAKADSVVKAVRNPVDTLRKVPQGASRFFGRIGEGLKGGKSLNEDSSVLAAITGVTKAKAKLAAQLGVSPYTSNEELCMELDRTAQAMAGGGLLLGAGTSMVGGGLGTALDIVSVNQTLQDTLVNSTPEDLRIFNRKKLTALGVDLALADEFLMHPWYSPWLETLITDALMRTGVNPTPFLREACRALTLTDAAYFEQIAQVLALYDNTAKPLRCIQVENGLICGLDVEGVLVIPLSCDFALWTERTSRRAEEFIALTRGSDTPRGLALWVDGTISSRMAAELAARKVAVKTGVFSSFGGGARSR